MKVGKLKQILHQPAGQVGQPEVGYQRDRAPRPALGTINEIFTTPRGDVGSYSGVIFVTSNSELGDQAQVSKRAKVVASPTLGFLEEDKVGIF